MEPTVYFTVTNYSYLYKAIALKNSLSRIGVENLKIYMFDVADSVPKNPYEDYYEIINSRHHEDYLKLAFKYDVVEFTTSLKPTLALRLIGDGYKNVIFLDPDTYVYDKFDQLINDLKDHEIILTPHYIVPQSFEEEDYPDLACLKYGGFNLGFFAVTKSKGAIEFLKWWEERCIYQCYFETQNGLSTDQKWIVIANTFFTNIKTFQHFGYNVAYWNANERTLEDKAGNITVNNQPLVFIHFSSLIENKESKYLSTRSNISYESLNNSDVWKRLYLNYIEETLEIKRSLKTDGYIYGYDCMNGYYLTYTLRRHYGENMGKYESSDPFNNQDLFNFAIREKLLLRVPLPTRLNESKVSSVKLKIVVKLFKKILKLIGYKHDINISRLLIYLSSPHRIKSYFD